ncbi:MAG: triosephosphate isomerase [Planctomycetota bacterium]|nr:MAG: triosephosphate isomerase [Planctomycetota bacterium]
MKPLLIAGNWKMYTVRASAIELAQQLRAGLASLLAQGGLEVVLLPPAPFLLEVVQVLAGTAIAVGAQCCHGEDEGAYTGAVSAPMIASTGARWVLCGHSERRRLFGESNREVGAQLRAALRAGLRPVLCVGETLEQREAGRTHEVVALQLRHALEGLDGAQAARVVIAYEPVWAIGTGRSASPQQAAEVHGAIRALLPAAAASEVRILYGGSVKPDNAAELLGQPQIDGVLVGGASLHADSFCAIAQAGSAVARARLAHETAGDSAARAAAGG